MEGGRLNASSSHFDPKVARMQLAEATTTGTNSLSVVDNRVGKNYELSITATKLAATKHNGEPARSFDPAYMSTVTGVSRASSVDGDKESVSRYLHFSRLSRHKTLLFLSIIVIISSFLCRFLSIPHLSISSLLNRESDSKNHKLTIYNL